MYDDGTWAFFMYKYECIITLLHTLTIKKHNWQHDGEHNYPLGRSSEGKIMIANGKFITVRVVAGEKEPKDLK